MNKNIESVGRLSPLQQGILYHLLESPNTGTYFQQFSCHINGITNFSKWQECWQRLSMIHPALRTLFTWEKREQPLQIVRQKVTLPWQEIDWSEQNGDYQKEEWQALLRRDRDQNFELDVAPLVRFTVVKTAHNSCLFLFSFHHILLDGWSQRLLLTQALRAYHDRPMSESEYPTLSYADFVQWIDQQDRDAALQYWTKQLSGFTHPTLVSEQVDLTKNVQSGKQQNVHELALDENVVIRLLEQARANRVTLNAIVLGLWSYLLAAETGSQDVLFGTTVAGRSLLSGADKTVGLFINTLPFRASLPVAKDLFVWFRQLQSAQASNIQFEQTPLSDIQAYSELEQSQALFDSILVFENLPVQGAGLKEQQLEISHSQYSEFSHYPLALLIDPSHGLNLIGINKKSLVSDLRTKRILLQFKCLLEQVASGKITDIAQLDTIPREHKDLLLTWNQTQVDFSAPQGMHHKFEQYAEQTPLANALIFPADNQSPDLVINYQTLNNRANQLARHLRSLSSNNHTLVVVALPRSAQTVITFVATLKAGFAYIALDESMPNDRVQQLLNSVDSAPMIVVTQNQRHEFELAAESCSVSLEQDRNIINQLAQSNLDLPVAADQLAYIIFTSGSTGLPKGVMVDHAALVNSTLARSHYYLEDPERFLLMSSFSTDSSIGGIYWALCTGGTLVISPSQLEQNISELQKLFLRWKITHTLCIPSLYQLLLELADMSLFSDLKSVIVAGESCQKALVSVHQNKMENSQYKARLYNEYGPSEATVWCTVNDLTDLPMDKMVPIGQVIANTQCVVLDRQGKQVAIGMPGELCIAGKNLAQGYFSQPQKTSELFITANIPDQTQELRYYKTGDRVVFSEEGELYFLGRVDHQIKVRGFRVEPEEVEAVIHSFPGIEQSAVFLKSSKCDRELQLDKLAEALTQLEDREIEALFSQFESPTTLLN